MDHHKNWNAYNVPICVNWDTSTIESLFCLLQSTDRANGVWKCQTHSLRLNGRLIGYCCVIMAGTSHCLWTCGLLLSNCSYLRFTQFGWRLQWGGPVWLGGVSEHGGSVSNGSLSTGARSRALEPIFNSATSWSKFLLLPTTCLRWWMEWIYQRNVHKNISEGIL